MKPIFNILSIDWDYFFPDALDYSWAHRENKFLFEHAWVARTTSINKDTKEKALDKFFPKDFESFWKKVLKNSTADVLLGISESQVFMWELLMAFWTLSNNNFMKENYSHIHIWNFDAHHNLSYGDLIPEQVKTSDWAYYAFKYKFIEKYNLIYPGWRKEKPEFFSEEAMEFLDSTNISYEIPEKLPNFDLVFIARSGAWTPPWCDNQWMQFVEWWRKVPDIWDYKKVWDKPLTRRFPNLQQAKEAAIEIGIAKMSALN